MRGVRAGLRVLALPAAPAAVVARAEAEIDSPPANVVKLPARMRGARWVAAAAAVAVLAALVWAERARREAAPSPQAVQQAAREAAIAFAYVGKYARRTGDIVHDEVIEQRLVGPVEKAIERSGVAETKPGPGQS